VATREAALALPSPAAGRAPAAAATARLRRDQGITLLELVATLAVLGTLVAIFVPGFVDYLRGNRVERAILDMRLIDADIRIWGAGQEFPVSLDELGRPLRLDPWGHPYVYLRIETANRGAWRKDRFLNPLNSDYDLYSMGPDGLSRPPLTAAMSRDDIVRAGDGAFVGRAEDY
jgi:general secretion pathway protein G